MIDWFDRVIKYLVEMKSTTVHHPRGERERNFVVVSNCNDASVLDCERLLIGDFF